MLQVPSHTNNDKRNQGEEAAINVEDLVQTIGELVERVSLSQISRDGPAIVIPKVPELLRKGEEDAYEPSVLSIGPYHMAKPRLQPMQMNKCRFLKNILNRNPNVQLNDYILAIESLEERARNCYPEDIDLSKSDFVKMLLLDGCFIVECFLQSNHELHQIFLVRWNILHIIDDLILLENQIPFFILQCIFELATPTAQEDPSSFSAFAIAFCNRIAPYHKQMPPPPAASIHHFNHLYYEYTLWSPESDSSSSSRPAVTFFSELKSKFRSLLSSSISSFNIYGCLECSSTPEAERVVNMIPSAMKLHEAGVKLKAKNLQGKSFLDVTFSNDGVLEIPSLMISYETNSHFRNLIAFEQLYPESSLKFTAYVLFLNYIVNTPKDVALLYSKDIIQHPWGQEEEVVRLLNGSSRNTVNFPDNYLEDLYKEVDKYCKTRRHRWRATLIRNYFGSPWSAISLTAAVILLLLTFLQTFYSMYSYYHRSP